MWHIQGVCVLTPYSLHLSLFLMLVAIITHISHIDIIRQIAHFDCWWLSVQKTDTHAHNNKTQNYVKGITILSVYRMDVHVNGLKCIRFECVCVVCYLDMLFFNHSSYYINKIILLGTFWTVTTRLSGKCNRIAIHRCCAHSHIQCNILTPESLSTLDFIRKIPDATCKFRTHARCLNDWTEWDNGKSRLK